MHITDINNFLSAVASGFIIAGALVGVVAGIVRAVRWKRNRK